MKNAQIKLGICIIWTNLEFGKLTKPYSIDMNPTSKVNRKTVEATPSFSRPVYLEIITANNDANTKITPCAETNSFSLVLIPPLVNQYTTDTRIGTIR
jgi:hypothetical protein